MKTFIICCTGELCLEWQISPNNTAHLFTEKQREQQQAPNQHGTTAAKMATATTTTETTEDQRGIYVIEEGAVTHSEQP